MDVKQGDRVLVNAAPFIGSVMRCRDSILCKVVEVDGIHSRVVTEPPYREVELWVLNTWIERALAPHEIPAETF